MQVSKIFQVQQKLQDFAAADKLSAHSGRRAASVEKAPRTPGGAAAQQASVLGGC